VTLRDDVELARVNAARHLDELRVWLAAERRNIIVDKLGYDHRASGGDHALYLVALAVNAELVAGAILRWR